ncbi:hypothetical protein [Geodermatophilus sp. SYSU D00710]
MPSPVQREGDRWPVDGDPRDDAPSQPALHAIGRRPATGLVQRQAAGHRCRRGPVP